MQTSHRKTPAGSGDIANHCATQTYHLFSLLLIEIVFCPSVSDMSLECGKTPTSNTPISLNPEPANSKEVKVLTLHGFAKSIFMCIIVLFPASLVFLLQETLCSPQPLHWVWFTPASLPPLTFQWCLIEHNDLSKFKFQN